MSAEPLVLDPGGIQRLRGWGGDELVGKMIQLFLRNAPERLREIQEGLAEGELELVERGAHSLKSSAGNLGAEALRATCASLEDAAEHGREDEIRTLLPELELRFRRTIEALENHRIGGA